jgi:hypothetical protein
MHLRVNRGQRTSVLRSGSIHQNATFKRANTATLPVLLLERDHANANPVRRWVAAGTVNVPPAATIIIVHTVTGFTNHRLRGLARDSSDTTTASNQMT